MDIKRKLTLYGYHVLIAIDQLFNALIGGAADETLSSRTYRGAVLAKYPRKRWRIWYRVINALFLTPITVRRRTKARLSGDNIRQNLGSFRSNTK